jgi:hypothetical protein
LDGQRPESHIPRAQPQQQPLQVAGGHAPAAQDAAGSQALPDPLHLLAGLAQVLEDAEVEQDLVRYAWTCIQFNSVDC